MDRDYYRRWSERPRLRPRRRPTGPTMGAWWSGGRPLGPAGRLVQQWVAKEVVGWSSVMDMARSAHQNSGFRARPGRHAAWAAARPARRLAVAPRDAAERLCRSAAGRRSGGRREAVVRLRSAGRHLRFGRGAVWRSPVSPRLLPGEGEALIRSAVVRVTLSARERSTFFEVVMARSVCSAERLVEAVRGLTATDTQNEAL